MKRLITSLTVSVSTFIGHFALLDLHQRQRQYKA